MFVKSGANTNKAKDIVPPAGTNSVSDDFKSDVLPQLLGLTGGGLLNTVYIKSIPHFLADDPETVEKLKKLGLDQKWVDEYMTTSHPSGPHFRNMEASLELAKKTSGNPDLKMQDIRKSVLKNGEVDTLPKADTRNYVAMSEELKKKPGIWAHELGHAKDNAAGKLPTSAGRTLSRGLMAAGGLGGTIAAVTGADDSTVGLVGAGQSLTSLPILRDEFVASKNGYKLLRSMGKGRLASLAAFSGIPTYLMTGIGMNMLPYGIRKMTKED